MEIDGVFDEVNVAETDISFGKARQKSWRWLVTSRCLRVKAPVQCTDICK